MVKRRDFLKGCCAGIAALSGARVSHMAFGQEAEWDNDVMVTVFLRGGMDGLSFLIPYDDPNYYDARERLALFPGDVLDIDGYFGLHPSAIALKELYDQQHLALIHACGLPISNRSHFQAQDYIERGIVGNEHQNNGGWLARHLMDRPHDAVFDGVSFNSTLATSMEGYAGGVAMSNLKRFSLSGSHHELDNIRRALRLTWRNDDTYSAMALQTLDAADILEANPSDDYVPANNVEYPSNSFSRTMTSIAQLIKMDLGLRAATVDLGGWDTHQSQASGSNPSAGHFANLVEDLCNGLHAFWNDMAAYHGKITVVVMSEFGRRVKENDNTGTDHGHGGVMMVFNSEIQEKKVWGRWPGLDFEQLYERVDLAVTTDYRTVLSEILLSRMDQGNLPLIFPGYSFSEPLGLFGVTTQVNDWMVH